MENKLLNEQPKIKYAVQVNGKILAERDSSFLAEQFISTLSPENQNQARVVPITEGGKQFLLG